jgi:hypothetical protein
MHFDKPFAQLTLADVVNVHLEQGSEGRSFTPDFFIQSTLWVNEPDENLDAALQRRNARKKSADTRMA